MYGERILLGVRKENWGIYETDSLAVHQVQENILQRMLPKGWFDPQETRVSRVWN
jgi:hypothetical protein